MCSVKYHRIARAVIPLLKQSIVKATHDKLPALVWTPRSLFFVAARYWSHPNTHLFYFLPWMQWRTHPLWTRHNAWTAHLRLFKTQSGEKRVRSRWLSQPQQLVASLPHPSVTQTQSRLAQVLDLGGGWRGWVLMMTQRQLLNQPSLSMLISSIFFLMNWLACERTGGNYSNWGEWQEQGRGWGRGVPQVSRMDERCVCVFARVCARVCSCVRAISVYVCACVVGRVGFPRASSSR